MAKKIKTALFGDLHLGGSYIVEWDAVDPTTGDTVPGVKISDTSLLVAGDVGALLTTGPFMLVPGPGA